VLFDLDQAIQEEEEFQKELRALLARSETRLNTYKRARAFSRGESPPDEGEPPLTIPAAAELILRKHGILHVREIAKHLADYSIEAAPTTITTSLARYAKKGKVFKRLGGNRFSILKAK
jgi:hypothetical protein